MIRKNLLTIGLSCSALLLGLSGCRKDQIGPELKAAKDWDVNTNVSFVKDQATPNFFDKVLNQYQVKFSSADFGQEVSWKVVVKGLTSGAERVYEGTGSQIKADSTVWEGESSNVFFFSGNEKVVGRLYLTGVDSVYTTDTITIANVKKYHGETINGVRHVVVDNFNNNQTNPSVKVSPMTGSSSDKKDSQTAMQYDTLRSVEGNGSYFMQGSDDNRNGWSGSLNHDPLIGMIAEVGGVDEDSFYVAPGTVKISENVSADNLYFNIWIYGTGTKSTAVELKAYEIDDATVGSKAALEAVMTANGGKSNYIYDEKINDGWIYDIVVDWTGWKLVSVPYSAFRAANDLNTGGNGDRVKTPWRISAMAVSILSYPDFGFLTNSYVDYLVITENGTFQR